LSTDCSQLAAPGRREDSSLTDSPGHAGVEKSMNDATMTMLGVAFFITVASVVKSIASIFVKRVESRRETVPLRGMELRLERIEAAVDVIAVEVERIAEGQRFAMRLATERAPGTFPVHGRSPDGRIATPH
jgi:hypothetical protein